MKPYNDTFPDRWSWRENEELILGDLFGVKVSDRSWGNGNQYDTDTMEFLLGIFDVVGRRTCLPVCIIMQSYIRATEQWQSFLELSGGLVDCVNSLFSIVHYIVCLVASFFEASRCNRASRLTEEDQFSRDYARQRWGTWLNFLRPTVIGGHRQMYIACMSIR